MTTKPLLLLAALILCCCFASLHAGPQGCKCIRTTTTRIRTQFIKKVEVIPIQGRCRHTEIIVTRRDNVKFCIDPNVEWLNSLLDNLKKKSMPNNSTAMPRTSTVGHDQTSS
ncbi:C-X-C motif chemokine 10 isoform X1 [Thunnus thynnus]|uniref:C-X-C motif chemokine 10 isoform X1 n=1 Tax=Thunnus thynnus TaxID=8237 RepID=UPI0035281A66